MNGNGRELRSRLGVPTRPELHTWTGEKTGGHEGRPNRERKK